MNRIFSGIQPTGNLHLGNYLGAIRNWVALQNDYECIFCIVDLHALTQPQDPAELRGSTREVTAAYIASGIDPERCTIFNQSMVPAHTQLAWLLACLTPLGWLNRMTQFKERTAGKNRELAGLGLYAYPVLMAADILLYKATHVPVGEDQKQHLELARDLAGAFNRRYELDFFPLPEPQIFGAATRVMSLRDGRKKMSKSDTSDYSRINMTDDAETIALKIRRAKTDPHPPDAVEDLERRPEADNLIGIYAALSGLSREDALAEFAGENFSMFKEALSGLAVEVLGRIGGEMRRLVGDPAYIDSVLRRGAENASAIAVPVLREVQEISGLLRP